MKILYDYSWARFLLLLAAYAVCLAVLLPQLSLWLDEVLDLQAIRGNSISTLLLQIPKNAGGVPLGYLAQAFVIHELGYSRWVCRLPSALFSLLSCVGVFLLARRLALRTPLVAVLLFCLFPLQLRYALEARPYSQALACNIWASVLFFRLLDRPTLGRTLLYSLLVLTGLYTQPYTVFVPVAHLCWLGCFHRESMRCLLLTTLALVLAAFGFLPWYWWASRFWSQAMAGIPISFHLSLQTFLVITRELVGAGYFGTTLIFLLVGFGFHAGLRPRPDRLFWALYLFLPILLALLADAAFGYFFAIRQVLFVLTPLTLMAAWGIETLRQVHPRRAWGSFLLLLIVLLLGDRQWFRKAREDWEAAAQQLQKLAQQGSCLLFVPRDSESLYRFFVPELPRYACTENRPSSDRIAVAVSPYRSVELTTIQKRLLDQGFHKQKEYNRQGPRVEWYRREPSHLCRRDDSQKQNHPNIFNDQSGNRNLRCPKTSSGR